jgi:hypothetical protein
LKTETTVASTGQIAFFAIALSRERAHITGTRGLALVTGDVTRVVFGRSISISNMWA